MNMAAHVASHVLCNAAEMPQDGSPPVLLYLANDLMLDLQDDGGDNFITGVCMHSHAHIQTT